MMRVSLTPSQTLNIESSSVSLCHAHPVVNGTVLEKARLEVLHEEADGITVRYTAPALGHATFGLASRRETAAHCSLHYWVEGLSAGVALDSFGLRFESVENLRAYLRHGYCSWDGSFYVEPEARGDFVPYDSRLETGHGMTQLLPRLGLGSVILGFDRHDRFQQTFTFDTRQSPPTLTILTLWDQKNRAALARCESERLILFEHPEVEEGLRMWARLVAGAMPKWEKFLAPGRTPLTGWCSWYNLYGAITEENILDHLCSAAETARRENLPMRIFQIDDGFTPEMGDWLEVKPQFPRGMKPLLDHIRAAGFVPGLWIAPFMVGNRSRLYREHPDWVVKDRQTGGPFVQLKLYGEFRWHKRSEEYYILDATQPEAFEYLRRVFRTWRREWGCEYFKTDFMRVGAEHGPDKVVWHTPGRTRIEIWRRVAEMIREEIGEAIWLGCGCPLWAAVGLVDGIRIGGDAGVAWASTLSPQSLLRDLTTRNFGNHILWQIDPDCVLLRNRFHHFTEAEVRSLAIYAGMSGGVLMTSDHLGDLSPDRVRLWKLILADGQTRATCHFPFLGQTPISYERPAADRDSHRVGQEAPAADPALVQVRPSTSDPAPVSQRQDGEAAAGAGAAVFFFNPSGQPLERAYPLASLGLTGPLYVFDWTANRAWPEPVERVSVTLPAHDGVLLFLRGEPIAAPPERLP
jgi:hypothetical protein